MTVRCQLELVEELAGRMSIPERVWPTAGLPPPPSLMGGSSGLLLLFAELGRVCPDEKWDIAAHAHVLSIKESIERSGIQDLSLSAGLTGICLALQEASHGGTRYGRLLDKLNDFLLCHVEEHYFLPIQHSLHHYTRSPVDTYDLISGLVGVGLYALKNRHRPQFYDLTVNILSHLTKLMTPLEIEGVVVPGWYLPSEHQMLEKDIAHFPKGSFNLGLAHGVPGVLAFYSLAALHGVVIDHQMQQVRETADYLMIRRREQSGGYFWETIVSFENEYGNSKQQHLFARDAWCYGAPGVARSLFLAGRAMQSAHIQDFAVKSFESIFLRSVEDWNIPGPTFCHGLSGLMTITYLMAHDSGSSLLRGQLPRLQQMVLDCYRPEYPFGFQDHRHGESEGLECVDSPGLLVGATGVLLSLLTLSQGCRNWMWPLLIEDGLLPELRQGN